MNTAIFFKIIFPALFFVLISYINVDAAVHVASGVKILDIYKDPIANLTINIFNFTHSYNCTTNEYGYCKLEIGNFSINFTFCGNFYTFNVSINNELKNLTLNLSSTCYIPNPCNAKEDCLKNQSCYNGYCKNLNCKAGYIARNHQCEPIVGCRIGMRVGVSPVGARIGAEIGEKIRAFSFEKVSEISNCAILNESKIYILTQDMSTSKNICINITGNNVVLDCRWHRISGNGNGTGINILGHDIIVENCIIENFSVGIEIKNKTTLYCNMIQENLKGVFGYNVSANIQRNLIRSNKYGIAGCIKNFTIEENEIIKNNVGIYSEINLNNSPDLSNNVICSNNINVNFTDYLNISDCTLPDLAITSIYVPLISDENLTINITAENLFPNLYNKSAIVSIIVEGNAQRIIKNKTININSSISESFNFSLPSGIYFVTASIHPILEINESNNLNNFLSNAVVIIKKNQSIIYGKIERHLRLFPNINLTLKNNATNETINFTSDENGFFSVVLNAGKWILKSPYSSDIVLYVKENIIVPLNVHINLIILNVTDIYNRSLENAKIVIIDNNTNEGFVLFTNKNGMAKFVPLNEHSYKIFVLKEGYASYKLITQPHLPSSTTYIHISTEKCAKTPEDKFSFNNYTLKIYEDLQNEIKHKKIERVIPYVMVKKNIKMVVNGKAKIDAKSKVEAKAKCYVNITNIPENLAISIIENINGTIIEKPANASFHGVKTARILKKKGNETIPVGDVNINFTYKDPDFKEIIVDSGLIGSKNLSYAILHLDANKTNKIGEKILYLPVKKNTKIVCVNEKAKTLADIEKMIENDCDGKWIIMNKSDIIEIHNKKYYKILSNGTGVVELDFVFGDANKNEMLDLEDALKIIEEGIVLSLFISPRADINNDKSIDIFDVVEILEKISL